MAVYRYLRKVKLLLANENVNDPNFVKLPFQGLQKFIFSFYFERERERVYQTYEVSKIYSAFIVF